MEKMCISCLKSSKVHYSSLLTILPEFSKKPLSVLDLLSFVTSSQIKLSNNSPSKICLDCLRSLKVAYSFIVAFNYSQKMLEKYIKEKEQSNLALQENDNENLEEKLEEFEEKIVIITEEDSSNKVAGDDINDSDEFNKGESNTNDITTEEFSEYDIDYVDDFSLEQTDITKDTNNMEENVDMKPEVNIDFDEDLDQEIIEIEENFFEDISPKNAYQKFSCEFCVESYNAHKNLLAHIRAKHPNNWLNCQRNLKQSKIQEEKNIYLYTCQSCKMAFSSTSSLQVHIKRMHSSSEGNYKCSVCNEVLKSVSAQRYHRLVKHQNKKYACDMCDQKFVSQSALRQHITGVHQNAHPEKFLCSECGRGFKYSTALKYHMGKVHTNQRDYICTYCGRAFILIGELRAHQQKHSKERPHKCKYCEKSFKRSSPKKIHEKTHLGIFPHRCEFCNIKEFVTSSNMKVHWLSHRGNFTCEECGKGFAAAKILDFHCSWKHKTK